MLPAPFIVGVPRSGTTLLRLQLDAHPDLAIPAETGFGELLTGLDGDTPTRSELLDAITTMPTWEDLGVSRDELSAAFDDISRWSVSDGVRAYYALYAAAHGKRRYGDKTPGHALHMARLAVALPEAHFIHIIRDGRDVAASLRRMPFAPGDGSVPAIAAFWRDTIWRARRAGRDLPHYHEVRYERLVTEPEAALREICDFLALPFDPAMLQAHERAEERLAEMRSAAVGTDGVVRLREGTEILTRTRRPPDPSRIGRWRDELTEHEVAGFERRAGGALADDGYAPYESHSGLGPARAPSGDGRTPPMRVLIGRQTLGTPGGTETYMLTVARELERLGHEVTVGAEELDHMAEVMRAAGLRVARIDEVEGDFDALLAHDLPIAAALASRHPDTRLVYVAHSDLIDLQLPPLVPGMVDAVIACSDRVAARIRALPLEAPIIRLREPIDTDPYLNVPRLADRPKRALIVSNYLRGERRRRLMEAWESAGIDCVQVGIPAQLAVDVRVEMLGADIVVAKARAALEAMSCGRAVYLYDQFGSEGWVTPDAYPALEADQFAGHATPAPRTADDLVRDLAAYSPEMGAANHELVRTHHGARHHAIEVVAVLRGPHRREPDAVDAAGEVARLARASHRAESAAFHLTYRFERAEAETVRWRERATEAERVLAEANALLATRRVKAGIAVGRAADRLRTWR